jgi:hypothetical protein
VLLLLLLERHCQWQRRRRRGGQAGRQAGRQAVLWPAAANSGYGRGCALRPVLPRLGGSKIINVDAGVCTVVARMGDAAARRAAKAADEVFVSLGNGQAAGVSLEADDRFFASRVDLVPAELYVPPPSEEEDAWISRKFRKNAKGAAPKQAIKEATKKAVKRRAKFGSEGGIALASERAQEHAEEKKAEEEQERTLAVMGPDGKPNNVARAPAAKNYAELKARLAAKLALLRQQRGAGSGSEDEDDAAKAAASRKARREDKDAARERSKQKKAAAAALGAKAGVGAGPKAGAESTGAGAAAAAAAAAVNGAARRSRELDNSSTGSDLESALRDKVIDSLKKQQRQQQQQQPKISFGPLAGLEEGGGESKSTVTAASVLAKGPGKNNLLNVKKMLKKAEENKALLEELKQSVDPADRARAEEIGWDRVERKALGERVADPKHIKKHIKRIERKKQKSAEEWASRKASEEDDKKERIERRDGNIAKQKQERTNNKLKRKGIAVAPADAVDEHGQPVEKRKRRRPGFEGQHAGFLNGKDKAGAGSREGREGGKDRD